VRRSPALREDIGRHNAVDKVVGRALLDGRIPLRGSVIAVSGRAGYEVVQAPDGHSGIRRAMEERPDLFAGVLDLTNSQQIKRGASSDLNGNLRYERGRWLTHDFSGQVTANLAHTGLPSLGAR